MADVQTYIIQVLNITTHNIVKFDLETEKSFKKNSTADIPTFSLKIKKTKEFTIKNIIFKCFFMKVNYSSSF